jgi:ParB/RepB/Spo0J family partition protein
MRWVPPASLRPPSVEYREERDPEHISSLAGIMRDKGFLGVVLCRAVSGELEVIWGWTRTLAAIQARLPEIPVQVIDRELTETDITLLQVEENHHRRDYKPVEKIRALHRLKEINNWSNAELSRRTKIGQPDIAKLFSIMDGYPQDLWPLLGEGEGKVPVTVGYYLSRLDDGQKIRELTEKVVKGLLTRDGVEEQVASLLGGRKPKPKAVKARTAKGVSVVFPGLDHDTAAAELMSLVDAVKRAQKHGLPLSTVPQILRTPSAS